MEYQGSRTNQSFTVHEGQPTRLDIEIPVNTRPTVTVTDSQYDVTTGSTGGAECTAPAQIYCILLLAVLASFLL